MKQIVAVLLAAVLLPSAAFAAEGLCLRSDSIKQITMTGVDKARITDKAKRLYDVTFVGPCGARHAQVFFVLRPERMPACVKAGTALPTNSEGTCVVKTITARK